MLRAASAAVLLALLLAPPARAAGPASRPRLAVLVVVDQLGAGTLDQLQPQLTGGFRRAAAQGFRVREARIESAPTVTSPGHATLLTGAVPAVHGVPANGWYDRALGKEVQSSADARYQVLGRAPKAKDGTAPTALRVPTLGDALKAWSPDSRVLAVSGKDRAAIFSAGRSADLALWFDYEEPRLTTSTYYAAELPGWVRALNEPLAAAILKGGFEVRLPGGGITGQSPPTAREAPGPSHLRFGERPETQPLVNRLLVDAALAGARELKLGADDAPDLLVVSFSGTDQVGHDYGPQSPEYLKALLSVDAELARLLEGLDQRVGKGRWVAAITSDHGHVLQPEELQRRRVDAGRVDEKALLAALEKTADQALGSGDWFAAYVKPGFVARPGAKEKLAAAAAKLRAAAREVEGVVDLIPASELESPQGRSWQHQLFGNGYVEGRSPDYTLVLRPNWMYGDRDVAGHASAWLYDRAVPLLLLGAGVKAGAADRCELTDVAPTLARLLGVPPPAAAQGRVLTEALAP